MAMSYHARSTHVQAHDCHDGFEWTFDVAFRGTVVDRTATVQSLRGDASTFRVTCDREPGQQEMWRRSGAFHATLTLGAPDTAVMDLARPALWNWHFDVPLRRVGCDGHAREGGP